MYFLLVFCLSPTILLKHYSNIVITINRWKIQNTKMKLNSHMVFSSSSSPLLNNTAKWCQFETNCFKNNFHWAKYFDTKKEGTTFTKFYTLFNKIIIILDISFIIPKDVYFLCRTILAQLMYHTCNTI